MRLREARKLESDGRDNRACGGRATFIVDVERLHFFDPQTGVALGGSTVAVPAE